MRILMVPKLTRDKRAWQAHYDAFKECIVGGADGQVKRAASKFGLVADDRRVGDRVAQSPSGDRPNRQISLIFYSGQLRPYLAF